jgi:2-polyprenyl-3-methyl-5-hydroxy-6-metoxy-1,4-benzoquinol methylase
MISRVGIDITPGMIQAAQRKTYSMNTQFVLSDFEDYLSDGSAEFDLITMIGVLQQCNVEPGRAFSLCSENLRDGGQLFITTKNIKWNAFKKDGFIPEKGHAWFDPDNLVTSLKEAGFREIHCDGFLPRENRIVECNASHTVFFHCRR